MQKADEKMNLLMDDAERSSVVPVSRARAAQLKERFGVVRRRGTSRE
ncbi:hypothetical protein BN2476_680180 [Paraburkholderia piptadeniae]|uniref:Uncharacterized protein n=1 Tax=Paraburkholderia piptadeniae TaxID=1701573 RepID=A0A1N7SQ39_9BURK|nr:hypothetical protein [Paraburkholderia piptadeniae]SIT49498.1 hypothetical protein BN2476_680180 [Paraburkholderia piptadeniae]